MNRKSYIFMGENILSLEYARTEWSFVVSHSQSVKQWGNFFTVKAQNLNKVQHCHPLTSSRSQLVWRFPDMGRYEKAELYNLEILFR